MKNGLAKKISILLCIFIIAIMAKIIIAASQSSTETHNLSVLNDKNYLCALHGASLGSDSVNFTVTGPFTSHDPIFDYIISEREKGEYHNPPQVALWMYLSDNSTYNRLQWSDEDGDGFAETGTCTTKGIILRKNANKIIRKEESDGDYTYNPTLASKFDTSTAPAEGQRIWI